jgi:hypothetical protein
MCDHDRPDRRRRGALRRPDEGEHEDKHDEGASS